jgi:DNA-binding IclR family transcriptional regulator
MVTGRAATAPPARADAREAAVGAARAADAAGTAAAGGQAADVDGRAEPVDRAVVGSVVRALRLLDCFERGRPEMSLAELVRCSGYSKTTAYRLLLTLQQAGWLERGAGGTFRLTIKPFQVGSVLVDSLELRTEAAPVMARLAVECDETTYLTVPAGTHAVCLERIDSGQGVRIADLYVGGSQPLYLGAGPRVLLAHREDELLPAVLASPRDARTPRSLTDPDALRADLAAIRERGYGVSDEDVTTGVAAIGAPVRDVSGRCVAALSLGGLAHRILPVRQDHLDRLLRAAADISQRLGYRPA